MLKYLNRFTVILTLIFTAGYTYLGSRLAQSPLTWVLLAIPFILIWLLPTVYWSIDRETNTPLDSLYQWCSFLSMGLMSFLFVFTLIKDLLVFVSDQLRVPAPQFVLKNFGVETIILLSIITLGIGLIRALSGPRVKTVTVPIEQLPESLSGLKIVQISDLHVGLIIGTAYVQKVVSKINTLQPHLIAFTGDLIDGMPADLNTKIAPLYQLVKDYSVYYVTGNHEYYWGAAEWIKEFKQNGITVLENSNAWFEHHGEKILIGGVTDYAAAHYGNPKTSPDAEAAVKGGETAVLKILLAHQPQIGPLAAKAGFDLQLSGHTHAGQFFPWTLLVRAFHKFYLGLHRFQNLWIYVSPGTGFWGPPLRLGSTSEITLLVLKSPKTQT